MIPPTLQSLASLPKLGVSDLQEADALFFSGTDTASRLIEFGTHGIISHVGLATFDVRCNFWQCLHAYTPMVYPAPLGDFVERYGGSVFVGRWDGILPFQAKSAVAFGLSQIGRGYGALTIVDIAIHIVERNPGPIVQDGKTWICSELFQREYFEAGLNIPTDANGFCDPNDIAAVPQMRAIGTLKLAA